MLVQTEAKMVYKLTDEDGKFETESYAMLHRHMAQRRIIEMIEKRTDYTQKEAEIFIEMLVNIPDPMEFLGLLYDYLDPWRKGCDPEDSDLAKAEPDWLNRETVEVRNGEFVSGKVRGDAYSDTVFRYRLPVGRMPEE